MRNWLRKLFAAPSFPTEEQTRIARQLNGIFLVTICVFLSLVVVFALLGYPASTPAYSIFSGLALVIILLRQIMKRGHLRSTASIYLLICYLGLGYIAWDQAGVRDAGLIAMTALILLASVALGQRGTFAITALSILTAWILAIADQTGLIDPIIDTPANTAIYMTVVFLTNALFAYLLVNNLNASLQRAQTSESSLRDSNIALTELRAGLEKLVEERTAELSLTTSRSQRRAQQFEAVAEVARATAIEHNPAKLLPIITSLISEHFGYYHIGIFLLDEARRFAILRAANSAGGQKMVKERFQLAASNESLVGQAIQRREAQIATEAAFQYPDLPETRSEAVLPLQTGEQIIGALDIQSDIGNAFAKEDIEVLNVLADQVAIAIENSRLFSETTQALTEARTVYGQYLRQTWEKLPEETGLVGFRFTGGEPEQLETPLDLPEIVSAIQAGKAVNQVDEKPAFAVPLTLRDEVIGVLDIRASDPAQRWSESQLTLVQAVAERVALALENARLFEETTRRADRERAVSEITTKIRSTTDPQTMLQMALEELKRTLGAADVKVRPYRLEPEQEKTVPRKKSPPKKHSPDSTAK